MILQPVVENAIVHGLDDVLENANVTIDITVADVLLITVSDNGVGVPDQMRKKILSTFFDRKSKNTNWGMGLFTPTAS